MIHTYVARKNKRYRYYVCVRAQKQGWDTCPSKSVPALEIENFVVDRIRSIGKNPELASEVLEQARAQVKRQEDELLGEQRLLRNELKKYGAEMARLTGSLNGGNGDGSRLTERLAVLTERVQTAEERLAAVNEQIAGLDRQAIDEVDLKTVLSQFDPIWESLTLKERARVVRLLVARAGYDGKAEKVSVTFSPAGVKLLAEEMHPCEQEVLV
jgi:site-specific DNA recombinase